MHIDDRIGGETVGSTKRALRKLLGLPVGESHSAERQQTSADPSSDNPWFRAQTQVGRSVSRTAPAAAERELWPTVRRLLLTGLVGLLLVVGAWSVFVRPFLNRPADSGPAADAGVSVPAAQAAAARFALDYLSYSPANDRALRAAALAGETSGSDAAAMAWSGSGYITASDAIPGDVAQYPGGRAVVMVDARVTVAAPGKGVASAKPPAPASTSGTTTAPAPSSGAGELAAPAGAVPQGYSVVRSVWLRMAVPVSRVQGRVLVSSTGPVFTGDPAGPDSAAHADGTTDAAATTDSGKWIGEFMTAYAASGADYQSAPGTHLAGLGGAAVAADVPAWSLSVPDAAGVRLGSASVTWRVAGVDLSITQTYTVSVTQQAERWYASALGPKLAAPN